MLSNTLITPFCSATKTRPSAAQRIVVGKFRPENTVVSVNPGGSQRAAARLAAADANGAEAKVLVAACEAVAGRKVRIEAAPRSASHRITRGRRAPPAAP